MKKVVPTQMVAHLWAHQSQPEATNSQRNVYFYGPTIYSYGSHFPMASHVDGVVLFNNDSYSNTTSKHQNFTRRACSHLTVYSVPKVLAQSEREHSANLADYRQRYEALLVKASRARKHAEWHLRAAEEVLDEANRYAAQFRLEGIEPADVGALVERAKAQTVARAAETRAREAKRRAEYESAIPDWRAGLRHSLPYDVQTDGALLRVVGDEVQTSQGARFPVADVSAAWRVIRRCKATGTAWQRNGEQVGLGSFRLDSVDTDGNVTAGCHTVSYAECARLAELLGLIRDVAAA